MFWLYNILLALTSPFWIVWTYFSSKKRKTAPIWSERMGKYPFQHSKDDRIIWIHAVSVGEVIAARPILEAIPAALPNHKVVLSVTTSSGHDTAQSENGKRISSGFPKLYDHLVYFPLDVIRFTLSAMQAVRPEVIGLMESELWLNFLWAAKVFDAQVLILNGRVSDRSFPRMAKLKALYKLLLSHVDRCLMQTDQDLNRIGQLGGQNALTLGNCKYDEAIPSGNRTKEEWRQHFRLNPSAKTIVIGSTRGEFEEKYIADALHLLPADLLKSIQIIHAPRHIERAPQLVATLHSIGLKPVLRSENGQGSYLILDTYGELADAYGAADLAIIGGGFDTLGGQNLIQPLARGVPVLHGPHMQNFRDVSDAADAAGAALKVFNPDELAKQIVDLFESPSKLQQMSQAATALAQKNQGATERYVQAIAESAEIAYQVNQARIAKYAAKKQALQAAENAKLKSNKKGKK